MDRQKTEFLSVAAHELRNPMVAISYSIEMLRHVASPEVINKVHAVIERQATHMAIKPVDIGHIAAVISEAMAKARNELAH